uniref:Uncharacterized protein n=1 Tax=uncultured marine virus TaxID=186617 RepID=A0A0F7L8D2_9VIRU|nr:hypothetical protein [uncultured marine virus]
MDAEVIGVSEFFFNMAKYTITFAFWSHLIAMCRTINFVPHFFHYLFYIVFHID